MNIVSGGELYDRHYEPLAHIVDGIIVRNTMWLLAGRPKSGKSWLLLGLARALDEGGQWLGRNTSRPSRVLYLALEDGERRVWERIHAMGWRPQHVDFAFSLPQPFGAGGELIFSQLKAEHGYEVFILDTLRAALGAQDESDNNVMGALMVTLADLAHRDQFTLILSHHVRKGAQDGDSFESIRGASAIRGSYDGGAVLVRARGEKVARLELESRDLEVEDLMLEWHGTARGWQVLGTRAEYQRDKLDQARAAIIAEARAREITAMDAVEIIAREMRVAESSARVTASRILSQLVVQGVLVAEPSRKGLTGRPTTVYRAARQ